MKIIKEGNYIPKTCRFFCEGCEAVFEANEEEYSTSRFDTYDDNGKFSFFDIYSCNCPICNKRCSLGVKTETKKNN